MKYKKSSFNERNIIVSTCFGHYLSHYNMLVFPALVLPLSSSLGLSVPDVLKLSFYMYLFFGVTSLPWGIVADRIGAKALFYIFFTGTGVSGIAAAFCTDSPAGLTVCLAFIGIFSGIYHPIGLGLISKGVRRVSVALGINGMFGNIGMASAPLFTGLINWLWGPKAAYLFLGGLNFAGIIVLFLFPIKESVSESDRIETRDNSKLTLFILLLIAMMISGIVYRGISVVTPTMFELNTKELFEFISSIFVFNISPNLIATLSTSFIFLVGVIAQYAGGRFGENHSPEYSYLFFHMITIPIAFLIATSTDLALIFLVTLYFFFLLGIQPIGNTLVARYVPKSLVHSSYGLKFTLVFGFGSISLKAAGDISGLFGIGAVYPAMGMCSIIFVLVMVVLIFNMGKLKTGTIADVKGYS